MGVRCQNGNIRAEQYTQKLREVTFLCLGWRWAGIDGQMWQSESSVGCEVKCCLPEDPAFLQTSPPEFYSPASGDGVTRWGQNQPQCGSGSRGLSEHVERGLTPSWKRAWSVGYQRCGRARTQLLQLAHRGNRQYLRQVVWSPAEVTGL